MASTQTSRRPWREELALVRNVTEGLNYVANGLDLERGDGALTTDEEHPSGLNPWRPRRPGAERAGFARGARVVAPQDLAVYTISDTSPGRAEAEHVQVAFPQTPGSRIP